MGRPAPWVKGRVNLNFKSNTIQNRKIILYSSTTSYILPMSVNKEESQKMESTEESSKIPIATNRPCRNLSQSQDDLVDHGLDNRPGRHLSKSVSLKRTEESLERKRRRSPSPKTKASPKKKVSVLERKKALERKYQNQLKEKEKKEKNVRESVKERKEREREKYRKENKNNEDSSDDDSVSIAKMLKTIMKDMKEVKDELKTNNEVMENMGKKISKLETRAKTNEEKNDKRFKDMQVNVDKQIKENNKKLEATISKTIIDNLKPKITAMHSHIVENDLSRIVQEQLQIKAQQETLEKEDAVSGEEDASEELEEHPESSKETDGEDTSKVEPEKKKTKNKKN